MLMYRMHAYALHSRKAFKQGQTWWSVPSCDQYFALLERVQSQANGIAQSFSHILALLLAWATVKDSLPAVALILCQEASPLAGSLWY